MKSTSNPGMDFKIEKETLNNTINYVKFMGETSEHIKTKQVLDNLIDSPLLLLICELD